MPFFSSRFFSFDDCLDRIDSFSSLVNVLAPGSTAARNINLSQLLARTPHSQPLHGLPLEGISSSSSGNMTAASPATHIGTPPPSSGGAAGANNPAAAAALMNNPRASPAINAQNSANAAAQLRQSPQLPRTNTPGNNLQFATNGWCSSFGLFGLRNIFFQVAYPYWERLIDWLIDSIIDWLIGWFIKVVWFVSRFG